MKNHKYLFGLLILILIIYVLHIISLEYFLYWRFLWTDILMHFLGGLWISLASYHFAAKFYDINFFALVVSTIGTAVLIGVGWELFEYVFGIVPYTKWYVPDTVSDILMDMIGGIVGFFFILLFSNIKIQNEKYK